MDSRHNTKVIWESFGSRLKRFIKSRVSNPSDAEDVLQEVFLKIHKNLNNLDDKSKLPAWIYMITKNSIIDFYRKKGSGQEVTYEENRNYLKKSDSSGIKNIKGCLNSFINKLPDKYRKAVELSDIKGLKQKEIAQILNISIPGTKSRIQRGRK